MSRSPWTTRASRPALWLSLLLSASACRATAPEDYALSSGAVVLDFPVVKQDVLYECGLVALSSLCQYYGVPIPPPERERLAQLAHEREGLSGAELEETLEGLGFEVYLFAGALDRSASGLYTHIERNRPVLVMTSPGGDTRHYCLFLGYDPVMQNAVLMDPARGRVLRPLEVFDASWERCQRFALLAVPQVARRETLGKETP